MQPKVRWLVQTVCISLISAAKRIFLAIDCAFCTANDIDELSTPVERVAAVDARVAAGGERDAQLGMLAPRKIVFVQGDVVDGGLGDVDAVLLPLERLEVADVAVHRKAATLPDCKVTTVNVYVVC